MQSNFAVQSCRIKREEDRLKREIDERELKEAEELLAKKGKGKKLKEGEKLDKNAIMQVNMLTACILCHVPAQCENPGLAIVNNVLAHCQQAHCICI